MINDKAITFIHLLLIIIFVIILLNSVAFVIYQFII